MASSHASTAAILAVVGGILVPMGLALVFWGLASKPVAYKFMALGLALMGVGAVLVVHAAQLDREP